MTKETQDKASSRILEKPKADAGDAAHTGAKMVLSAIPIVGGSAAEIFSAIVRSPLDKRRDEWIESIIEALKVLEEKIDDFKIGNLVNNETFVTTLMHTSQVAIRNHQKEKLDALRNAALNASLPNAPDKDLQLIFVSYIDSFAVWHLRILKFFDDPKKWGQEHGITYPSWYTAGQSAALEHAFPELRDQRQFYGYIVKDLYARGLLKTDSIHTMVSEHGILASITSDMGKKFLRFILSPTGI